MNLITRIFDNHPIVFTDDGFFDATAAATIFGKKPVEWLRLDSAKAYINAVLEFKNETENSNCVEVRYLTSTQTKIEFESKPENPASTQTENSDCIKMELLYPLKPKIVVLTENDLVKTVHGGSNQGTWIHQDLVVMFARWLDPRFAFWCDRQIHALLTGHVDEVVETMRALKQTLEKKEAHVDGRINALINERFKSTLLSRNYSVMEKHASHVEERNVALEDQVTLYAIVRKARAVGEPPTRVAKLEAWADEQLVNMQKGRWYTTQPHI